MFADRKDAGRQLAKALEKYRSKKPLILALPRGGVAVGFEIAQALDAELDVVITRKIGAPGQPELALGAVVDGPAPVTVLNEHIVAELGVTPDYLENRTQALLAEIARRAALYRGSLPKLEIGGRTAIVVDDGIATGATVRAALRAVSKASPRWTVLAVPVAPPDAIATLKPEADEIVCLETPRLFFAIGQHYRDFRQLTDTQVLEMIKSNRRAQQPHSQSAGGDPVHG